MEHIHLKNQTLTLNVKNNLALIDSYNRCGVNWFCFKNPNDFKKCLHNWKDDNWCINSRKDWVENDGASLAIKKQLIIDTEDNYTKNYLLNLYKQFAGKDWDCKNLVKTPKKEGWHFHFNNILDCDRLHNAEHFKDGLRVDIKGLGYAISPPTKGYSWWPAESVEIPPIDDNWIKVINHIATDEPSKGWHLERNPNNPLLINIYLCSPGANPHQTCTFESKMPDCDKMSPQNVTGCSANCDKLSLPLSEHCLSHLEHPNNFYMRVAINLQSKFKIHPDIIRRHIADLDTYIDNSWGIEKIQKHIYPHILKIESQDKSLYQRIKDTITILGAATIQDLYALHPDIDPATVRRMASRGVREYKDLMLKKGVYMVRDSYKKMHVSDWLEESYFETIELPYFSHFLAPGIEFGGQLIVGGPSGAGKSVLAVNLAKKLDNVVSNGHEIVLVTTEGKQINLRQALICHKPFRSLRFVEDYKSNLSQLLDSEVITPRSVVIYDFYNYLPDMNILPDLTTIDNLCHKLRCILILFVQTGFIGQTKDKFHAMNFLCRHAVATVRLVREGKKRFLVCTAEDKSSYGTYGKLFLPYDYETYTIGEPELVEDY